LIETLTIVGFLAVGSIPNKFIVKVSLLEGKMQQVVKLLKGKKTFPLLIGTTTRPSYFYQTLGSLGSLGNEAIKRK
jgi:hypothetical protein